MMNPPNEPARFVTCPCQHCNGQIEFDASGFAGGETRNVECPHFGSFQNFLRIMEKFWQ
jgi:hypothetical protein